MTPLRRIAIATLLLWTASHAAAQTQVGAMLGLTQTFTGANTFAGTGVFTDTQLNLNSIFNVGGLNFTTEYQLAEGSHGTTEGASGGVAVPVGATVIQAEGVGGFATNSSTATIAYGGYFQSRCVANGSHCGGINPVVFDTAGLTTGLVMYNDDALTTPRNAASAYQFIVGKAMGLNATVAGSYGSAFYSYTQNPGASQWLNSFRSVDGAAGVGLLVGSVTANTGSTTSNSQTVQFSSWNAGTLINNSLLMDSLGNLNATAFLTAQFNEVRMPDGGAAIGVLVGSLTANTGSTTSNSKPIQFTSWNGGVANNNSVFMDSAGRYNTSAFSGVISAPVIFPAGLGAVAQITGPSDQPLQIATSSGQNIQLVPQGAAVVTTPAQIVSTLGTGTAPFSIASTTPVATLVVSNHPKVVNCTNTAACAANAEVSGFVVHGTIALTGGAKTVTALPFTGVAWTCVTSDNTTPGNGSNMVEASATTATVTGTGTDVIAYNCTGK